MNKLKCVMLSMLLSLLFSIGQAHAQLNSHVEVTVGASVWTYTLLNDEPAPSNNFITNYLLAVDAPVTVLSSPAGWDYQTDNSSYVFWFNTDLALPYPHDIAPGSSLDGFSIGSTSVTSASQEYNISSWDHNQDAPGSVASGTVLAPSTPAAVPEPSTITTFSIGALSLLLFAVRRRVKSTGRSI